MISDALFSSASGDWWTPGPIIQATIRLLGGIDTDPASNAGAPNVSGEVVAFSPYEIVIRDSRGRDVLLFKHAITSIDLPDGWRRTPGPEVEA